MPSCQCTSAGRETKAKARGHSLAGPTRPARAVLVEIADSPTRQATDPTRQHRGTTGEATPVTGRAREDDLNARHATTHARDQPVRREAGKPAAISSRVSAPAATTASFPTSKAGTPMAVGVTVEAGRPTTEAKVLVRSVTVRGRLVRKVRARARTSTTKRRELA